MTDLLSKALEHIAYLSQVIGGRGSCTPQEKLAASYAAAQMELAGIQRVEQQAYRGAISTYQPYGLAFMTALVGVVIAWFFPTRAGYLLAVLCNALGGWAMLAESDFANHWLRILVQRAGSQNAIGVIPAQSAARQRVVLCAHLDTHRTPIFYSSKAWHRAFGALVGAAFVSMALAAVLYLVGVLTAWSGFAWLGIPAGLVQVFALLLCLHADRTPFSPGANDNASGVGVALALAQHVAQSPLEHTETWLVFTGCEEASAYGICAFLDGYTSQLGDRPVFLMLDQVGVGRLQYLSSDGLIRKHATHPLALELAAQAIQDCPHLQVTPQVGIAYTDALPVTRRGLAALTLVALPRGDSDQSSHWHQMTDTMAVIDPQCVQQVLDFSLAFLRRVDRLPDSR